MPAADAPTRPHFQQLANLVHSHAAARCWPNVEFQAAFRTVDRVGEGASVLEGNSVFWDSDWDADASLPHHTVGVEEGEEAWRMFLVAAFYSDLLRADAQLLEISEPNPDMNLKLSE
jgi:hypothetical protein